MTNVKDNCVSFILKIHEYILKLTMV